MVATHERDKFFKQDATIPLATGCHGNVAETSLHDLCCTGVMACRRLKYGVCKGGLGMTRGVSF